MYSTTIQEHSFSLVMSSSGGQWYPYSTSSSQMADFPMPDNITASMRDERWNEWINNESQRRLLAACFILDVHTSVYYQQHLSKQFPMSTHPIPLIGPTQDLWAAQSPERWELLVSTNANAEPTYLSGETPTAEQIACAPRLDHAVFLASEALRLPKRSSPSILDRAEVDETSAKSISSLFPGSAVGNTYLALHYTPLHDLLVVSGDTWLFSKKIASLQIFQQHKRQLQLWCNSSHIATAARYAAKALVAFLDHNDHNNRNTLNATVSRSDLEEQEDQSRDRSWNMLDISDYWAMYACALVCWALGHRAMVRDSGAGSGPGSDSSSSRHHHNHSNANAGEKGEREAIRWLKMVAGLSTEKVLNVRGRKETISVISMVKRRLEDEAVGSRSRLLVDAIRTLKNLEERVNYKWF